MSVTTRKGVCYNDNIDCEKSGDNVDDEDGDGDNDVDDNDNNK